MKFNIKEIKKRKHPEVPKKIKNQLFGTSNILSYRLPLRIIVIESIIQGVNIDKN